MTIVETATIQTKTLLRHLRGVPVTGPGEPGWDVDRRAYNLAIDQQPALIAKPFDVEGVAAVIRFAQEAGLRVAPQRTGHNAAPLGDLSDAVLLRTDALQGVSIDVEHRTARVRAGAKWENVVPRASELGLAALHGSTPDVSVVGYSLGGGLGWYARKHGLAANRATAIELVTAEGRLRRVDNEHEPELFWALRGGGGNFGVVTALEFDLLPIDEVYAGVLFFPFERAGEVLHAWHEWLPTVPDEVTSVGRLLQVPPMPELPDWPRGQSFAVVEAVHLGTEEEGRELLEPLRRLGPAMDTFTMVPPVGLAELHMDPPDPVPYTSGHLLAGELPAQAIDDFLAVSGPGSGSPLVSVELRQLGGALARSGPQHGAVAALPGAFAMFAIGVAPTPDVTTAMDAQIQLVTDALRPHESGHYSSFTEDAGSALRFFPDETYDRLRRVKAEVDPENVFRANHAI